MWPFKKKPEPKELQFDPASFDGPKVVSAVPALWRSDPYGAALAQPRAFNRYSHLWAKAPDWAKVNTNPSLRVVRWSEGELRDIAASRTINPIGRHVTHTIMSTCKPHYALLSGRWTRFVTERTIHP